MTDSTRREFLRLVGRGATGLVVLQILPGCEDFLVKANGTQTPYEFITPEDPDSWFWFSALDLDPSDAPHIAAEDWRMEVRSGGKKVGSITYRTLKAAEAQGKDITYLKTMRCIFGTFAGTPTQLQTATGVFRGIPLKTLLEQTSVSGEASKLRFEAKDGFQTSISNDRLMDDKLLPPMLAYELNGRPLTPERGGPVRLIVPEMWAFKSMKWITSVDATTDFSTFGTLETNQLAGKTETDNPGLIGLMPLANRPDALIANAKGPDIEIRGMALVGGSRIASVEVQLDTADFVRAKIPEIETVLKGLGDEALLVRSTKQYGHDWPYPDVWAPWTYTLKGVSPGMHTLNVRAVDLDGRANPAPIPGAGKYELAAQVSITLNVT